MECVLFLTNVCDERRQLCSWTCFYLFIYEYFLTNLCELLQRKVEYIKRTTEILKRDYGGDIPDTIEKLCGLPGWNIK